MAGKNNTKQSGFTLIEILVVTAIIGLLTSIAITSMIPVRRKARDTQRISNLNAVRKALELYYDDHNSYPYTNDTWTGTACGQDYIPGSFTPGFISVLPKDPACGTSKCIGSASKDFLYISDGISYKLIIDGCFETTTYTNGGPYTDPARGWEWGAVYNPGSKQTGW